MSAPSEHFILTSSSLLSTVGMEFYLNFLSFKYCYQPPTVNQIQTASLSCVVCPSGCSRSLALLALLAAARVEFFRGMLAGFHGSSAENLLVGLFGSRVPKKAVV
jgi:hypothetical protein